MSERAMLVGVHKASLRPTSNTFFKRRASTMPPGKDMALSSRRKEACTLLTFLVLLAVAMFWVLIMVWATAGLGPSRMKLKANEPTVLCIFLMKEEDKRTAVLETWAQRCTEYLVFTSTADDPQRHMIKLPIVNETRNTLALKGFLAWR